MPPPALPTLFVQDNHSLSTKGTLRGLHMQVVKPQGKLIRVIEGEIWDVALDVRPESPTFMRWTAAMLSAGNFRQLYIPPGCAHGFYVVSDVAQVQYKCTELYDPADEMAIAWNDVEAAIEWPVEGSANPVCARPGRATAPRGAGNRGRPPRRRQGGLKTALYVRSCRSLAWPSSTAGRR